jgi:hypothetical protein
MNLNNFNFRKLETNGVNEAVSISKNQITSIQDALIKKYGDSAVGEYGADGRLGQNTYLAIMQAIEDATPAKKEESSEYFDYTLPITLTGSYTVGKDVPFKYDARHSFDRRKSDKFGGRMLRGWDDPVAKAKWGRYVKLDQGKGINQVMKDLLDRGINPDVSNIKIEINGMSVRWSATIIESQDGQRWVGVGSRGSAGSRASMLKQIEKMKRDNPNFRNWTLVLDYNQNGIYQQFWKYTE